MLHPSRVHPPRVPTELEERARRGDVHLGREDAGCSIRGFGADRASLNDRDPLAMAPKLFSQRAADDAAT